MNKQIITWIIVIITILIILFGSTGCNRTVLDLNHTFDYAECYLNNEYKRYDIKKWTDYDGEQIQIQTVDDKTYLLSMNYSRLIKE